jgi:uncharacterized protein
MNTPEETQSMLNARSYCVIGASRDPDKFGFKVFRAIKADGKKTYPVNPNTGIIGKATCYPTVRDLPETVEVAVFVVPPEVTEQVLPECHATGINSVWLQQGSESDAAIAYCLDNGMSLVAGGPCIMTMLWDDEEL